MTAVVDTEWIGQKVHQESNPQQGERTSEPLCAILTGVSDAPMTYDEEQVTCDACKAISIAIDRGKAVHIGIEKP